MGAKSAVQDRVRAAGFPHWTLLKPGFFMENFLPSAAYLFPRGVAGGLVSVLRPETRLSLVAVAAHTVTRLHHDDCADEVFHCAVREPASGRILSLLDVERLGHSLKRIRRHIRHIALDRISPLAVPVMLEIGRERVAGEAEDVLLGEAADSLIDEAMGPG